MTTSTWQKGSHIRRAPLYIIILYCICKAADWLFCSAVLYTESEQVQFIIIVMLAVLAPVLHSSYGHRKGDLGPWGLFPPKQPIIPGYDPALPYTYSHNSLSGLLERMGGECSFWNETNKQTEKTCLISWCCLFSTVAGTCHLQPCFGPESTVWISGAFAWQCTLATVSPNLISYKLRVLDLISVVTHWWKGCWFSVSFVVTVSQDSEIYKLLILQKKGKKKQAKKQTSSLINTPNNQQKRFCLWVYGDN